MFKILKITILTASLLFNFTNLFAKNISEKDLSKYSETLNNIEKYLNDITYLKANFVQDNKTTYDLSEGMFYLSRPNNLRIDYTMPFEASLYSNDNITTYYDKELDEITNIPTSKTPLNFLLKENISFKSDSFKITNIEENDENIFLSFVENDKENEGILILNFNKKPLTLSSIKVITEDSQEIEMVLFNVNNEAIKNSVFKFINPRIKTKIN